MAASNRDLDQAVSAGQFRDDLLFRLNVVELILPPLRERKDRVELAEHLLAFFARQLGKKVDGFTAEARQALLRTPGRATSASSEMRSNEPSSSPRTVSSA